MQTLNAAPLVRFAFCGAVVVFTMIGCASLPRESAVPPEATAIALPLGIPNIRFHADGDPLPMAREAAEATSRERALLGLGAEDLLPPAALLALSGGGDDGAFGAGVLSGWSEAGTRPTFNVVTGISTGALAAPIAFLGSAYDPLLRQMYTKKGPDRIFFRRSLTALLFGDAIADTSPLADTIAQYADQALLDAIAEEYRRGRLLFIGTTDLDAQRPVIWNIGALGASRHPRALELFRKILLASASIPGVFQPVMLDVELNGQRFQEMHVDGGATGQLFLYPASVDVQLLPSRRSRTAYVIANTRLGPHHAETRRGTISIASRAIATMLQFSAQNDVLKAYFLAQLDGWIFNLAYIGADFRTPRSGPFDEHYMKALFDYGYGAAVAGDLWHRSVPALRRRGAPAAPRATDAVDAVR